MVNIAQSQTQSVPIAGTNTPAGGQDWDILDTDGVTIIATQSSPGSWAVSGTGPASVHVPAAQALGTYTVRVAGLVTGG